MKKADCVILIGMPGCGKSTLGVLLAKSLLCAFEDTDLVIQQKEGAPLYRLVEKLGQKGFAELEESVVSALKEPKQTVIATGGSVVYSDRAMKHLKSLGVVVYLKLPAEEIVRRVKNIKSRGIVMEPSQTLEDLYAERTPLYEKYADVTVDCKGLDTEQCVSAVLAALKKTERPAR